MRVRADQEDDNFWVLVSGIGDHGICTILLSVRHPCFASVGAHLCIHVRLSSLSGHHLCQVSSLSGRHLCQASSLSGRLFVRPVLVKPSSLSGRHLCQAVICVRPSSLLGRHLCKAVIFVRPSSSLVCHLCQAVIFVRPASLSGVIFVRS